ncbi:MAG: outer membrane beta-barrel protein [Flavobacteriales bacterium]|nr:outer membrane beta-barrel protein [Flavobacteriales bacterium]MCB9449744.1 outer membrane beta-barrel protein [Flavobacteriales bacterium]
MKTLRRMLLVLAMTTLVSGAFAQSFEMGHSSVQVGYGFGNFIRAIFKTYEDTYSQFSFKGTGPAFAKFEYAVSDKVGVGVNLAYVSASVSYTDTSVFVPSAGTFYRQTLKWYNVSALARINVHFGSNDKFDPYWGAGLGYRTGKTSYTDNDPNYDNSSTLKTYIPFGFETTFGARYYFTDNIGIYAETGLAKAVFQVGLSGKF